MYFRNTFLKRSRSVKNTLERRLNVIYLVRHGLDDENFIGGYSNVGLIREGKEQIKKRVCG